MKSLEKFCDNESETQGEDCPNTSEEDASPLVLNGRLPCVEPEGLRFIKIRVYCESCRSRYNQRGDGMPSFTTKEKSTHVLKKIIRFRPTRFRPVL